MSLAASLAGLAPVTRESGTWKGRSFIRGGRDKLRRMLYMPALAAIRANPVHAQKCAALLAAGKPPKVAITAVMRKLLVPANALVQQETACGRRNRPPPSDGYPVPPPRPGSLWTRDSPGSACDMDTHLPLDKTGTTVRHS